ncbi:MAG TPA: nicotinate-nucleotide adenylyltransferase [Ignavibacteria bacterium]|nr:nicotinate-nucleotide adenylyltransferase [Ignavibacteria bacterium]
MKKYGIFGGTFNPPHIAHSIVAENVRQQLNLDKIIFIPSGNPPLKNSIPAEHRLAMAKLAFGNNKNFEVSEIEIDRPDEKSFTVNTLQMLQKKYINDQVELFLIVGIDNLIDFPKWKEPEKLFELSEVVVINRPNFSDTDSKIEFSSKVKFLTVPFLEISSSSIRQLVSDNRSIHYLVNPDVEKYIADHKLYI